tara:strand:+ start:378 stop:515 length:138 start_codon:yes stop_codon:yes gene_type:complete
MHSIAVHVYTACYENSLLSYSLLQPRDWFEENTRIEKNFVRSIGF